eukprot:226094-Prymnesium_polylepis.1
MGGVALRVWLRAMCVHVLILQCSIVVGHAQEPLIQIIHLGDVYPIHHVLELKCVATIHTACAVSDTRRRVLDLEGAPIWDDPRLLRVCGSNGCELKRKGVGAGLRDTFCSQRQIEYVRRDIWREREPLVAVARLGRPPSRRPQPPHDIVCRLAECTVAAAKVGVRVAIWQRDVHEKLVAYPRFAAPIVRASSRTVEYLSQAHPLELGHRHTEAGVLGRVSQARDTTVATFAFGIDTAVEERELAAPTFAVSLIDEDAGIVARQRSSELLLTLQAKDTHHSP